MGCNGDDDERIGVSMETIKMKYLILTCFILTTMSFDLLGQKDWEFKKEEDGITAHTRSREGIKFKEYKVEMELEATLAQVISIFKDFEVHTDLFPGTEDIKVYLDEPERYVTYIKFDIPFPARDRDAVFNNLLSYDASTRKLKIEVECMKDEYETNPKLIQMTFCEGAWEFTDLGNGTIQVMNQMIVDPAGFAPAFIVNSKTVDDPIKTFKSLRKMIDNDKYRGHSFSLLENE